MRRRVLLAGLLLFAAGGCRANGADDLALTLPPAVYAVPGSPMGIWFANIVVDETMAGLAFAVDCPLGEADAARWLVTPTAAQVGDHPLRVTVTARDGSTATAGTTLRVVPADAGAGGAVTLLVVGDSLTNATAYVNQLGRRLSEPGNPAWTMLGTNRPGSAGPGVAHEGYGGWTWARFVSYCSPPDPEGKYRTRSPFVYPTPEAGKVLDPARFFAEECGGKLPDYVTFLLGINDCFGAPPADPAGIDARVDAMFAQADLLLAKLREALPNAVFGIGLTTPGNARDGAFVANYGDKYTRWGWRRIQHRLVQREIEQYGGREAEGIRLIPTEVNLDPVDGYPDNNGVHPAVAGYNQIGESIYAWLKDCLATR